MSTVGTLALTDLPLDILLSIVPYLSPPEFLALSASSPSFQHDPEFRYAWSYWRKITIETFRVPNHPVVEGDGQRWMRLYRRMQTQTKVYGWGSNSKGQLEGAAIAASMPLHMPPRPRTIQRRFPTGTGHQWPTQLQKGGAGIVSDVQCGGWSTTILDSEGSLYTSGVLDGMAHGRSTQVARSSHKLAYPPGFDPPGGCQQNPYTAIRQFSSGRSHVLGLSDSGRIWSWDDANRHGLHIKFLTVDLVEGKGDTSPRTTGCVRSVVAGWCRSTAYITGTGIIVWEPSNGSEMQGQSDQSTGDGMLVLESWVVPESGYLQSQMTTGSIGTTDTLGDVGEVVSYAVLADYVLFVTHLGKVFASKIPSADSTTTRTIQIVPNDPSMNVVPPKTFSIDVQGSHTSFAIFKRNGEVLTGSVTYLHALWDMQTTPQLEPSRPKLQKIPSLQHTGVISMAFGDYHYHALHADGTISSYGHEPQRCGALGLGDLNSGAFRGLKFQRGGGMRVNDRRVLETGYTTGRRVWFEDEKLKWINALMGQSVPYDRNEGRDRVNMLLSRNDVVAEVSEWIEQRLLRWEDGPALYYDVATESNDDSVARPDDDGLPSYFALSVTAAGWHSAALVLVNEGKARRTRRRYQRPTDGPGLLGSLASMPARIAAAFSLSSNDGTEAGHTDVVPGTEVGEEGRWVWEGTTFPRLRLRSGEVMPGTADVVDYTGPKDWKAIEEVDE